MKTLAAKPLPFALKKKLKKKMKTLEFLFPP